MREIELKAAVPDESAVMARLLAAGATTVGRGRLEDCRYDDAARSLTARDLVLRLRTWRQEGGTTVTLDWKGSASFEGGYKHRDEISVTVDRRDAMAAVLDALGFVVTREIDREITLLSLGGAILRFERFARMDTLLEVEGPPPAIEAAIAASGLARSGFTPSRLVHFVLAFEARTGQRAAICDREARGDYAYALEDA